MNIDISRRGFIQSATTTLVSACTASIWSQVDACADEITFVGLSAFKTIIDKARAEHWSSLPIGQIMGKVAKQLEGIPYVSSTLEIYSNKEVCSVNLKGLDCVTFFETTLALARIIKARQETPENLLKQIEYLRYRGGKATDYSSRLHYTSDWFADNVAKKTIKLLEFPESKPFAQKVSFMSTHPASYRRLLHQPEQLAKIKAAEKAINSRSLTFVPIDHLAAIEALLQTGDIVGVCTSQAGLDIVHTGIIYRAGNIAHFMDASSKQERMKVTIEGPLHEALTWSKNLTGVIIARPLEI